MPLRVIDTTGPAGAEALDDVVARLRAQTLPGPDVVEAVARIVADVRDRGEAAVVEHMRRFTDPNFNEDLIAVDPDDPALAAEQLDPAVKEALLESIANVRAYQQHVMPADPQTLSLDGAELGMRFTPMDRVGLCIPGGRASYPSSVIMTAVPAQVAGVESIAVICPPPTRTDDGPSAGSGHGDISPLVLGACGLLGIDEVYRIGGAQGVAALAYGTEMIPPVDFIAGPGSVYVQEAKRQVFGAVGIDGLYGPSEVIVVADATADPAMVASDLLAQAEHDPGSCVLVALQAEVIDRINAEVDRQLPQRKRREAIERSLNERSVALIAEDGHGLVGIVDTIAAEHVTLAVAEPMRLLEAFRHGGAWFLGDRSPVASGDYYAGPSHCLPTGTTARFTSGISVYTYLKRSSVEHYPNGPSPAAIDSIATLAEAEGLDAHAASVRARRKS